MKRILLVAKPCPFCNSTKLDISSKSNGHTCVYCRSCLTYGPRVLEYELPEDIKRPWMNKHYFKSLKDKKNNSDNKPRPSYVKKDDSEVTHNWYYEESVRRWNERVGD